MADREISGLKVKIRLNPDELEQVGQLAPAVGDALFAGLDVGRKAAEDLKAALAETVKGVEGAGGSAEVLSGQLGVVGSSGDAAGASAIGLAADLNKTASASEEAAASAQQLGLQLTGIDELGNTIDLSGLNSDLTDVGALSLDAGGDVAGLGKEIGHAGASAAERAIEVGGFAAEAKVLAEHSAEAATQLKVVVERLAEVPGVGAAASTALRLVSSTEAVGIGILAGSVLAVGEAAKKYVDLAEQVTTFKRVAGESAEESTRWVAALNSVGISADEGARSIALLSKNVTATPQNFDRLGISIARNADDTVNLTETLLNVADAYTRTDDAQTRNAIGTAAFGRQYRLMIPLLEQGRAGIEQLRSAQDGLFSSEDLKRAEDYRITLHQLGQAWDGLVASFGRESLPGLTSFFQTLSGGIHTLEQFNRWLNDVKVPISDANTALLAAAAGSGALATAVGSVFPPLQLFIHSTHDASHSTDQAKASVDGAKRSLKDYEDQLAADIKRLDEFDKAEQSLIGTDVAASTANLHFATSITAVSESHLREVEAADKVHKAQEALNAAIRNYGPSSQQAHDATVALQQAQVDQTQATNAALQAAIDEKAAVDGVAQAAVNSAREQANLTGATFTSQNAADVYITALGQLAAKLSPTDPLRVYIQQTIDKLNELASPRTATVSVSIDSTGATVGNLFIPRASGGDVSAGKGYLVGEERPELFVPETDGHIYPSVPAGAWGGGQDSAPQPLIVQQRIEMPVILDGREIGRMINRHVEQHLAARL